MFYRIARPLLFRLSPEQAHGVAMAALRLRSQIRLGEDRPSDLMGLRFPNRIGLAAGFDKSAAYIDRLGKLGFGFIEVGTVTPRPQPGHLPPNLFRLIEDEALINRLGFNNDGVVAVTRRLERRRYTGICGVNIGKNADTPIENAAGDYITCLCSIYPVADYVTINVSSPNSPGLRGLQDASTLPALRAKLVDTREQLSVIHRKHVPLLIKLAPDLDAAHLDALCAVLKLSGVDGVIATNT